MTLAVLSVSAPHPLGCGLSDGEDKQAKKGEECFSFLNFTKAKYCDGAFFGFCIIPQARVRYRKSLALALTLAVQ